MHPETSGYTCRLVQAPTEGKCFLLRSLFFLLLILVNDLNIAVVFRGEGHCTIYNREKEAAIKSQEIWVPGLVSPLILLKTWDLSLKLSRSASHPSPLPQDEQMMATSATFIILQVYLGMKYGDIDTFFACIERLFQSSTFIFFASFNAEDSSSY